MEETVRREDSDGEEDMPDYRVLAALTQRHKPGAEAPVIPKRGEKDFEPTGFGGQTKALSLSRDALFSALRTDRAHSSKTLSTATWDPVLNRAFVFVQRGQSCVHMGVTERRTTSDGQKLTHLELHPEETVYLLERGALDCRMNDNIGSIPTEAAHSQCIPISVAQAYAQILGKDGATFARYQIYAYLKRLGYIVQRADLVDRLRAQANDAARQKSEHGRWRLRAIYPLLVAILRAFAGSIGRIVRGILYVMQLIRKRLRPTRGLLQVSPNDSYDEIFQALQIVPTGVSTDRKPAKHDSHLRPFFYAWRPATRFKRTQPPPPEFRICVLETNQYSMLHLEDFEELFAHIPLPQSGPGEDLGQGASAEEVQLQAIREQNRRAYGKQRKVTRTASRRPVKVATALDRLNRFLQAIKRVLLWIGINCNLMRTPSKPPGNVFLPLKAGRRSVVVAIVDQGTMSLLRFGEAEFSRWKLAGRA
ncbi:tRNA-splicing endonuclease subunit sen54 [Malassezia yamatoensis]|uniref:tRNA-splicing endonuclease subunit sen54 n=1 Tax=Malassezia yamatoensis TaxID=253288 RepID=A0AAJ5YS24_9BASI|nr:tRNA-splicing endonuclease subunit sen54 [Malassezia yamatoensis]